MPRKNPQEPTQKRKKALNGAAVEVLEGSPHGGDAPRQDRIDGMTKDHAWEEYKEVAGDYARKAQSWRDSQELLDVRLGDLVKVHSHHPFDEDAAARVSREAAKAVEAEKQNLASKQEAKKALDAAWHTVRNFEGEAQIRPLIPDEDE